MSQPETARDPAYEEAIAYLASRIDYERTRAASPGTPEFKLDRTRRLLAELGNPHDKLRVVHVAGTKGKGSTTAMISAVLHAAGLRVGSYTSPHFERIEERFAVDGLASTASEVTELVNRLKPIVQRLDAQAAENGHDAGPTYFELTTAMAFCHFVNRQVDIAVVEVGLGGRLDSTNVCRPDVSVITSIGFDHTQQLGNTLEEIAFEKAGIIKHGAPAVSGVTHDGPRQVIEDVCRGQSSPLLQAGREFEHRYRASDCTFGGNRVNARIDFLWHGPESGSDLMDINVGMLGAHQAANAAVAVATCRQLAKQGWPVSDEAIRAGLSRAHCPGRIEIVAHQPIIILDTSHNVSSVESLIATLQETFPDQRRICLFAASKDKDAEAMLRLLEPHFEHFVLTRYHDQRRAYPIQDLLDAWRRISDRTVQSHECARDAWRSIEGFAQPDDMIVVAGSFFLAGEIRPIIAASQTANSACPESDARTVNSPLPVASDFERP